MLKKVQRKFTKCITKVQNLPYGVRLFQLRLHSLEFWRYRGDMIQVLKFATATDQTSVKDLITLKDDKRMRGNYLTIIKKYK